ALLLAGSGSTTLPGVLIVAVLLSVPVADGSMVASTVYVTLPPAGRFTVSVMLPLPLAVHVPPSTPTHVHVAPVRLAGKVSVTDAPSTLLGPAFDAVMVYVTLPPGVAFVTPSVLVMLRSALDTSVVVSVALLLAGFGSTTLPGVLIVAVLLSVPVADGSMVAS